MKIRNILLVMLLAFSCYDAFAQAETDYEALYKKEFARQDSLNDVLQDLKNRKKELVAITGTDNSKLTKKSDAKIKELDSKKAEQTKLLSSPNYKKLQELLDQQKQLESQIVVLSTDTTNLVTQVSSLEAQIGKLNGNVAELETIKNNVSKQLLDESKGTLEKPFSQLSVEELTAIKTKCSKYSTDQKINALIAKTDDVLKNKRTYDDAIRIANSKFNKGKLISILDRLTRLRNLNAIQQNEINQVRGVLSHFEPGMTVFKEFIQKLNKNREGVTSYSKDDLNDDLRRIMSKNNIKGRIDSEITQVPYLNKAYKAYIKAIKANPMNHSAIEAEILGYSN